jgi:hypothetical protein
VQAALSHCIVYACFDESGELPTFAMHPHGFMHWEWDELGEIITTLNDDGNSAEIDVFIIIIIIKW